jgi:hypothetical protein
MEDDFYGTWELQSPVARAMSATYLTHV